MVTIKSDKKNYGINFPTNVDEITKESLDAICKDVKLPKHYCIVALCMTTKIFDFTTIIKNNKNSELSVIPLMAKISDEDAQQINTAVGDRVIVDRSTIERGAHISLRTVIESNHARDYFSKDDSLIKQIMNPTDEQMKEITRKLNIVLLEFKIVPVNDISASIPRNIKTIDPFIDLGDVYNNNEVKAEDAIEDQAEVKEGE